MSRKIVGITVGTPMNPQALVEKTEQAKQIEELSKQLNELEIPTDYAKEDHTHSEYANKEHTHSEYLTEHQDLSAYAKKSELPTVPTKVSAFENDKGYLTEHQSLSAYSTTVQNDAKYQPKGNYLTSVPSEYVTETELTNKKYLTSIPSEYVTDTEMNNKLKDLSTIEVSNSQPTQENVDVWVNPTASGEFTIPEINDSTISTVDTWSSKKISDALANAGGTGGGVSSWNDLTDKPTIPTKTSQLTNDSGYLTSVPSEYITETELNAKKYLTAIPSEYITETELNAKGYATTSQVNQLSEEIVDLEVGKVNKNNITLEQHTDGLIYIFIDGKPKGNGIELNTGTIVEGDVIGTLDEDNNILLSGNLADGTYAIKYENEDGTYTDIGNLVVSSGGSDVPELPYTNLANPSSDEWMDGYRITSSGVIEPTDGQTLVNTIPYVTNDMCRVKGMTNIIVALYKNGTFFGRKTVTTTSTDFSNVVINGDYTEFSTAYDGITSIRFYGVLSGTAEDVIITINEEIV